jgi:CheY-like chemotaxis protein
MPGMDGIQTVEEIHEIVPAEGLPIIIMATAYNRDDVLSLARRCGIRSVMTKPLSPSTMLNMLVDIFGRSLSDKDSKLKKAHEMAMIKKYLGARILLVEDNEVNQLVASRILKNAGLEVDIANHGLEAVHMVKEKNYDLVLMDIQMPEMDGFEATRVIRAREPFKELPIVAMTAHAMSGDRELSLKAGMNDHINKPINVQELFSTLARHLKNKIH